MKKTKKALLAALACSVALTGAVGLAACNSGEGGGHTHTWETEWSYNPNNLSMGHFHKCTDSTCNEVNGTEGHHWSEWTADPDNPGHDKRTCDDCHAVDTQVTPVAHEHNWDDWVVTEANQPTATAKGKATRECLNDNCDATDEDKEFELPVLTDDGYTKTDLSAPTCATDGKILYSYVIDDKGTEATTDDVTVEFMVTVEADESLHTWRDTWVKGEEGHWHSCNVGIHQKDFAAHDTDGVHGECSVCHYFAPIVIDFSAAEGNAVSVPVAYLATEDNERAIEITGLTENHEYTLTCSGVFFSQSIGNMGANTIDLLYTPNNPGDPMTLGCYASGDSALENLTFTLTDNGEVTFFEGETITLDTASNFTAGVEENIYFKFEVATAGKYHFEWTGGATAADVLIGVYTGFGVGGASGQLGDNSDGNETFDLAAGTYYVGILSNKEEPAGSWNYVSVSGTVTLKEGEATGGGTGGDETEVTPITVTLDGGSGFVPNGDTVTINLSGLTVGKTYKITESSGMCFIQGDGLASGEFTYVEGMTLTAMCMMPGGTTTTFTITEVGGTGEGGDEGGDAQVVEKTVNLDTTTKSATVDIETLTVTPGATLTLGEGFEEGKYYRISSTNANVKFYVGMDQGNPVEFAYDPMMFARSGISVIAVGGNQTNVVITIEEFEPEFPGETLEVGTAATLTDVDGIGFNYKLVIAEDGNYTFTAGGEDAQYVSVMVGTVYDFDGEYVDGAVEPTTEGGNVYALTAGTYYVNVVSTKENEEHNPVAISGTLTVSKVTAEA